MDLFLIYDCDEWKSLSSLRLIMVSDAKMLESNLATIKRERNYTDDDMEIYIFVEEMTLNKIV